MLNKFKDFLLNQVAGRMLVRLVGTLATGLASGAWGVSIDLSPAEIASVVSAVTGLFNALVSKLKPRNPAPAPEAPKA